MAGARRIGGVEVSYADAAVVALNAGCDLVLLCNQSAGGGEPVDALLEGLERARADGAWSPDPDGEARRRALLPAAPPLSWDALMHDPAYQHALESLP
jgi:beta-N-acetylhexosaminidase